MVSPLPPRLSGPHQKPWFNSAGKVVAAAASTGAALVSVISFLFSYGVLGKSESHQTIGNLGAAWVGLRPAFDTATAIGDTLHLAATVTDKNGSVLVGAKPTWLSENAKVATVLRDGSVIAQGPGATTITVTVNELIARARVVVKQRIASVAVLGVAGDTTPVVPEGESLPLLAEPRDGRGHAVAGLTAQWHVDDSSVATLDANGVIVGKVAGRTIVSATVEGVSGHTAVTIVATAAALAPVAGASQRATAGSLLAQAIVVRVTSRRGRPVQGTLVKFRPADGQGSVEPEAALSDADGRARTLWTLSDLPGRQTLLASVERVDSALAIVAEADPVASNTRIVALSEDVSGGAGQPVGDPVAIRLTDSTGRALPDVPVTWLALDGGSVEPLDARTDSLGRSRARWLLGPKAGTQRVRAQVGASNGKRAIPPATITATALAGAPVGILVISGDGQRGTAGAGLAKPIVVRVVDATGNGVADAALVLSPSDGSVRDTSTHTDSTGIARIRWTLGRSAGEHALGVHMDGVKKLLRVTAHALPAPPANLSFDDAPPDGRTPRARGKSLVALVTDAFGNPVPDARVSFSTKSGSVSPGRAVSDAKGRVKLVWNSGSRTADQSLTGVVQGTDVRGTFIAQAGHADVRQAGNPVPPKPEAPKPEAQKPEPPKPEATKLAPTKLTPTKPAAAKPAPAKPPLTKPAPTKAPAKVAPAKPSPARTTATRTSSVPSSKPPLTKSGPAPTTSRSAPAPTPARSAPAKSGAAKTSSSTTKSSSTPDPKKRS